ncbi:MAG TPA: TrkA family potassium uptake protein [Candidatus Acetothermia bacterium]|jgi:trk system potassium uptake protein TrkA|nr:TrkA family potassium uptake protein [Candidatus Acetothermia bacterium]HEX32700.1 TrkA family potassium uptake protein [Candidatus Acetothermia bacterium]
MYMIIVGAGSIGLSLIQIATKEKNNVVVVESNVEKARDISNKFDITVLNGNATLAETLREAGSERADALIATTSDDAVNLMVVSIAEQLKIPSIVSIVNEKAHAEFFNRLGANVMENPEEVVANHLYTAVKRPKVKDFTILSQGDQVFRIALKTDSTLVGKSFAECMDRDIIPDSMTVIALERQGEREIVTPKTIFAPDDLLTLFSLERASDEIIDKLTG